MTQHFDSSIQKVDKDGNGPFLSSTLEDGEQLYTDFLAERGIEGHTVEESVVPAENVDPSQVDDNSNGGLAGYEGSPEAAEAAANAPQSNGEVENTVSVSETGAPAGEEEQPADDDEDKAPAKSAVKEEWFTYAQKHGFEGEEGDITKEQLIEQYGPQE